MAARVVGVLLLLMLLTLALWRFCSASPAGAPEPRQATPPEATRSLQELARSPDVAVRETPAATLVEFGDVLFEFDRTDLRPDVAGILGPVLQYLLEHPERRVRVNGHADGRGTAEYNRELSLQRSHAVRSFLVAGGVAPGRLTVRGWGESLPAASNRTEAGRRLNRRVEIVIETAPGAS